MIKYDGGKFESISLKLEYPQLLALMTAQLFPYFRTQKNSPNVSMIEAEKRARYILAMTANAEPRDDDKDDCWRTDV